MIAASDTDTRSHLLVLFLVGTAADTAVADTVDAADTAVAVVGSVVMRMLMQGVVLQVW